MASIGETTQSLEDYLAEQERRARQDSNITDTNIATTLADSNEVSDVQAENVATDGQINTIDDNLVSALDSSYNANAGDEGKNTQQELANSLKGIVSGEEMGASEIQARKLGERSLKAELAANAGVAGSSAALVRREAAKNRAIQQNEIAAQAQIAKLKEQSEARQQLSQLATGMREQDMANEYKTFESTYKVQLANQGIDFETLKFNAMAGNQMAMKEIDVLMGNASNQLRADLANQGIDFEILMNNVNNLNNASVAQVNANLQKLGMDNDMRKLFVQANTDLSLKQIDTAFGMMKINQENEQFARKLDQDWKATVYQGEIAMELKEIDKEMTIAGLESNEKIAVLQDKFKRDQLRVEKELAVLRIKEETALGYEKLKVQKQIADKQAELQLIGSLLSTTGTVTATTIEQGMWE